jgi:hypothetical protein
MMEPPRGCVGPLLTAPAWSRFGQATMAVPKCPAAGRVSIALVATDKYMVSLR